MSVSHKAKERQARTREARLKRKENISFATITKQESVKNIFYRHYIHAVYLNDKVRAYHFANSIGIKTPNVFIQPSKDFTVPFRTVPLKSGHVLKPKSEVQSRGVYIIHEENRIYDMTQKKNLLSFTELKESASEMLKKGLVKQDNWILEEVIYFDKKTKELAWDIKFYCFYGKAVLALRTSRDGDLKRCWFNREGKRVDTGKYSDELYEAPPVSEALFQLAERISYQIPAAFYRIDFLETMDTVFLGEFTPLPSDSDAFSDKYDNILGLAFLDAQARLNRDLFAKKDFSEYRKFYEQTSSSKPHALGIKKYFLEGIRRISKPINHKEIREQMNQSFDDGDYSYALKKYDQIPTRKKALGDHLIALEAKWALNQETLANKSSPSYHIDLTDIPSSNKNSNSENLSCAKTLSSMQLYKESTPYWISFLSGAKNINLATTRKIITTLLHLSYEDQHASLRILDLIKEKMEEILDNHHTDFINYTYVLLK
ncbi:MAG: ATP-grasp fold amidoligase family protein, partial [Pseudomonadota bacterium]|nr:ATP-grasp fold amidoligase family protein [Pseudomonadota bacterium]